MTYNIRYDNPQDGVNAWPNRKTNVFDLIKKYDPDIIGVQEALHHQLEDITKALPAYTYLGVGRDDGKTAGEYSAIVYKKEKFTVNDQNTFWLSETPDQPGSKNWDAAITRIATWSEFKDKKTARSFVIVNTHFDHVGTEARTNSAKLIKEKLKTIHHDLPVVVMGDLNCTRDEAPYQVLLNPEGVTLYDPAPANAPGTFCSFSVNTIPCRPIDYIFHTGAWRNRDYAVITDNNGKYYPSDHLPVLVKLALKKK